METRGNRRIREFFSDDGNENIDNELPPATRPRLENDEGM